VQRATVSKWPGKWVGNAGNNSMATNIQ